ncbi:precorrin-2 C(20)-methyltransferase [uncultured Parabacteroides sp.]|uniref:precorrin-2 C(20)-methyltransferase n=1 Tax=uncultured Parabacteroides sp. TaxID=512312 RepID=UPI00259B6D77|nr:precorrin-2 C(20)-methyltransferase [uncultured Parabacteroides sp.]
MTYPISFVSLGPGEPELITVKGLRQLQKADIIYCPATRNRQRESISRAADIVRALEINETAIHCFILPMSKDRTEAWKVYDTLYNEAATQYVEGKQIVIVAEGDAGFYSSIQYLYDKFTDAGIAVQRIAGIPAFIAAGALAGLHIVKQEEQIVVIPGTPSAAELSEKINAGYVIVIMKLSQCVDAVHECIRKHPQTQFHYFENVGTEKEYYTSDRKVIADKAYPYFSLMIIQ